MNFGAVAVIPNARQLSPRLEGAGVELPDATFPLSSIGAEVRRLQFTAFLPFLICTFPIRVLYGKLLRRPAADYSNGLNISTDRRRTPRPEIFLIFVAKFKFER